VPEFKSKPPDQFSRLSKNGPKSFLKKLLLNKSLVRYRARNRRHPAVDREGAVAKKTVE
jgi:hypothetical protein